jgi:cytochrome P450
VSPEEAAAPVTVEREDRDIGLQAALVQPALQGSWGVPPSQMTRVSLFAEVDEIFKSRDFAQAGNGHGDGAVIYGKTLISLSGDDHFERRRLESVLFRKESLLRYETEILEVALTLALEECVAQRSPDGVVRADLVKLLPSVILRVSSNLVGLDGLDDRARFDRLRSLVPKLGEGAAAQYTFRDHAEVIREAREARDVFVREFFGPAWERRAAMVAASARGELADSEIPVDLITVMIRNQDHFKKWDDEVHANEAILYIVASSGNPTSRAMDAMANLQDWLHAHPEDLARVEDPQFLRLALTESLRLKMGVPFQVRRAVRDTVLKSTGRRFSEGDYVALEHGFASRDAELFGADADHYDLRRTPPSFGFAFGGGPHTCNGKGMSIGEPNARGDAPLGLLVRIIGRLFAAGLRLDPARPPRLRPDTIRNEWSSFPVLLEKL